MPLHQRLDHRRIQPIVKAHARAVLVALEGQNVLLELRAPRFPAKYSESAA